METAVIEAFLALVPENRRARTRGALEVLQAGLAAGQIWNADLTEIKFLLNNAHDDAFGACINQPFTAGRGWSPEAATLDALGSHYGLRSCIAVSKKLKRGVDRSIGGASDEFYAALVRFYAAALPIAVAVERAKPLAVKGRKPNPEAQARRAAEESKKTIRTCGCCFRGIAIHPNGRIVDHGYRLPHGWFKTSSCPGAGLRPLEVSPEGLDHMIDLLTNVIAWDTKALRRAKAGKAEKLTRRRTSWQRGGDKFETITPDHADWEKTLRAHIEELESSLRGARRDLANFQKRRAEWAPGAGGRDKRKRGK